MNGNKRRVIAIMLILLIFVNTVKIDVVAAGYKINKSKLDLYVNEIYQLKINNKIKKATWKSSSKNVATVTNSGKVTTLEKGVTRISVQFKEKNKTVNVGCTINVKNDLRNIEDKMNIEYYELETKNEIALSVNSLYCFVTNNSNYDLKIVQPRLVFYDEYNNKVSVKEQSYTPLIFTNTIGYSGHGFIYKGKQALFAFENTDKAYKYYKLEYEKIDDFTPYEKIEKLDEKVELKLSDVQDKILLELNNKTSDIVKLQAFVSFYKENRLIRVIPIEDKVDLNNSTLQLINKQYHPNFDYDTYKISYTATVK